MSAGWDRFMFCRDGVNDNQSERATLRFRVQNM